MAQINKYADRTAYEADTARLRTQSAVSHIENESATVYDGVNVVVDKAFAGVGDLAVYDLSAGAIRFVRGGTLDRQRLPESLVPLAVVYARQGERLLIVSLENAAYDGSASLRWAAPYEVALSGFDLAAGGTFTLRIADTEHSFDYAAGATLADLAALVNADSTVHTTYRWTATVDEPEKRLILSSNTWSDTYTFIETVSGCRITRTPEDVRYQTTLSGILFNGTVLSVRRNNGLNVYAGGCNDERFLFRYSSNGSTDTGRLPGSSVIIRESVFTEADNPALVAAYPTYRDYLLGEHMLQYPSAYGAMRQDGRSNTAKIGRLRFVDIRGQSAPCYPAAAAALEYGVTVEGAVTGLEAGAWWLPSVEEVYLLMHDRVLTAADAESDPVNRTLSRMGGTTCYGARYPLWTSCEHAATSVHMYNNTTGELGGVSKNQQTSARPVSTL